MVSTPPAVVTAARQIAAARPPAAGPPSVVSANDAADLIHQAVCREALQTTAESQRALDDLTLAARVKASIIERHRRATYHQAGHKPYIIAAVMLLSRFEQPARLLKSLLDQAKPRRSA